MLFIPEALEFAVKHGISPSVFQGRPYGRWEHSDVSEIQAAFRGLGGAAWMTRIARNVEAEDGSELGGYIMHRTAGLPGLPRVYAEIRPDAEVETGRFTTHFHGDLEALGGVVAERKNPVTGEHKILVPYGAGGREVWVDVLSTKTKTAGGRDTSYVKHLGNKKSAAGHAEGRGDGVHRHYKTAKYVFAPSGKRDLEWTHYHLDYKTAEGRERHVARHHGGVDDVRVEHDHLLVNKLKDKDRNHAARIDVHPMALPLIVGGGVGGVVYFALEGCIKADAILSAGAAVFSVPSVSLWRVPELEEFVNHYLLDKTVVIVVDADWMDPSKEDAVINHARQCHAALRRMGVERVVIAAPPVNPVDNKPFECVLANGEVDSAKGVDDWLSSGGTLEGMDTSTTVPPMEKIVAAVRVTSRRVDGRRRNADVLAALSIFAGPDGLVRVGIRSVQRLLGFPDHRGVARALRCMLDFGLIAVEGGKLETRQSARFGGLEWADAPAIRVPEQFRAELSTVKLDTAI